MFETGDISQFKFGSLRRVVIDTLDHLIARRRACCSTAGCRHRAAI